MFYPAAAIAAAIAVTAAAAAATSMAIKKHGIPQPVKISFIQSNK